MSERFYWENGVRVPVTMPDHDMEPEVEVDSPALVMMRTLIAVLLETRNTRLDLECLSLISSVGYQGKSFADIAGENGITADLVSQRCVDLRGVLGLHEGMRVDDPALVMMRTVIGILLESPDVQLERECLSLISGVGYDGKSLADIARENMTTRALVSRRCVDLCKTLGVPPVRAMRNESGQENCRKARIKKIEEEIKNYHSK